MSAHHVEKIAPWIQECIDLGLVEENKEGTVCTMPWALG